VIAPGRVTIDDVAREAGVSKGTVSRVLNGKNWVSPTTRDAVERALRATGFVANASARSLARRRTGSIALVLGEPATRLFTDPNYALILQVLTDELAIADYSLVFMTAANLGDRDRLVRFLRGGHVDGLAFLTAGEASHDDLVDLMEQQTIPVVVAGRPFPLGDPLPYVSADESAGGRIMAAHLRDRGYGRIGVIGTHLESLAARTRVEAFLAEAGDRSGPDLLEEAADYSFEAGGEALRRLLTRRSDLDAVFAASDLLAAGALDAAHALGRRVPDDLAIAGYDDSTIAERTTPPLTTVRQDVAAVARAMVAQLLAAIDGGEVSSQQLPVELVVRDST